MKRSEEPIYWLLFGAGGVVAAVCVWHAVVCDFVLRPAGVQLVALGVPLGVAGGGRRAAAVRRPT